MKELLLSFMAALLFLPMAVFSQQSNPVLIVIESPDYEKIANIKPLKAYAYDDDWLFGEIDDGNLSLLKMYGINYKVVDEQGWSGEYYVLTPRPNSPALEKIKVAGALYLKNNSAVVKINQDEQQLLTAGYQLQKITKVQKPLPLPGNFQYQITFQSGQDSLIRTILDAVSVEALEMGVQRLQDFKTRHTYSDSIVPAAQWIYDQYRSSGYTDVSFDTFYINFKPHRNVIAIKPGVVYPDSVIMIGGHYDSIVFGPGTNYLVYAPGADDNASGAVAAIEAARIFANYEFEATLKFVAWDAEEIGLVGSQAYAQKAYYNHEPISLYINLDMIGNYDVNDPLRNVTIYANNLTMPFAEFMAEMAKSYTTLIPFIPGNSGGSDHWSFQNWGYRALFGQEGDFSPHWHKITDITDNMNFPYMKEVVQTCLATIIQLAGLMDNIYGKPYIKVQAHAFDDDMTGSSYGNGNTYIDAGETIELFLTLQNFGERTASDVTATLTSAEPLITIQNATQCYGSISPHTIATNLNSYIVQISSTAVAGQQITFIVNINDSNGNIWHDRLNLEVTMPELVYHQQNIEEVTGNGDDTIDPGEIFNLFVELENTGLRNAKHITSILKCDHPSITILDSLATFEDISRQSFGRNSKDPLKIETGHQAKAEIIPLSLEINEDGGFYKSTISFNLALGQGKILLIEDDGRFELSHYYQNALNKLGIPYLHWDTNIRGPVVKDTIMTYSRVIWYSSMEFGNSLFKYGTQVLENYLENGGKLFINGSLLPFSVRDSLLMSQYLQAKYINFKTSLHHLSSNGSNQLFDNISFWLETNGENNQSLTGEIDAIGVAQPIFFYDKNTSEGPGNIQSSGTAALAVMNKNYRAVLFSFGWEGIADEEIRHNMLVNILNWLQGSTTFINDHFTNGQAPITFDLLQNYPNPFNPETLIRFVVPQSSQVAIKIFNSLGQEIKTLLESNLEAGSHQVEWNGKDNQNRQVASGIYLYQLTAGNFQITRKMVLLY